MDSGVVVDHMNKICINCRYWRYVKRERGGRLQGICKIKRPEHIDKDFRVSKWRLGTKTYSTDSCDSHFVFKIGVRDNEI